MATAHTVQQGPVWWGMPRAVSVECVAPAVAKAVLQAPILHKDTQPKFW